eukprot:15259953-Heterocapsa_arctica.AAC.1
MLLTGLRASSLSPLDASQNAHHFAQHLSLIPTLSFKTGSCTVVLSMPICVVQDTLVMHTCA